MTDGPTISFGHVPSLDGLRGVAVTAVVAYHLWPGALPGGFIGVDVFFVLSGFLLTSLLVREVDATGGVRLGTFFVRRVRRLLPAMLLMLTALAIYALTWGNAVELDRLRRHGVASLLYVANWLFISDGTTYTDVVAGTSPLRHVWSLSIEEQFYLVLAAVVALVALRTRSAEVARRRVLLGACVLSASSSLLMILASLAGSSTDRLYFGADTRAQALLIGAALGAWLRGSPAPRSRRTSGATIVAVVALATLAATASETSTWMYRGGFTVTALAAGTLIVGAPTTFGVRGVLEWQPLRSLGTISYGVYLWHWPILVIFDESRLGIDGNARRIAIAALTLLVATLSYRLVEQPIRRGSLGRRWGDVAVGIGPVATAAVAALLFVATETPATLGADDVPDVVEIGDTVDLAEPTAATTATTTTTRDPATSVSSPPATVRAEPTRVVVLGDSVMHTLIGGRLLGGLDAEPWRADASTFDPDRVEVLNVARPACSFLPGEVAFERANGRYESASLSQFCGDWQADLDDALTAPPGADVAMVLLTNDLEDRRIDDNIIEVGSPEHSALLLDFVDQIRDRARAVDVPVMLVVPAPRMVAGTTDLRNDREIQIRTLFADYADDRTDVRLVDIGQVLCPADDCARPDGDFEPEWRYDGLHFSRNGAIWVSNWLTPQLEDLGAYS